MEEYGTKSKVTELEEGKKDNEQAFWKVNSGYMPLFGVP